MLGNINEWSNRVRLAFSAGEIGDGVAYQTFSFLVFTFYFTVVRLPVLWISAGFVIWSLWNSINDPLIGILSDRTKSRRGRRIVWMLGATVPLSIIMILLFTPPLADSNVAKLVYFVAVLFLFDLFYTAFNVNYNALWSEMFITIKDRSEVGRMRGIFVIVALIFAFVFPTLIIEDLTNQYSYPYTQEQYALTGGVAAIIIIVSYFIVLRWGAKQRREFKDDAKTAPPLGKAVKMTLKNRVFMYFIIAALAAWICNGILPIIVPLFATYVLGVAEQNSIQIGLLLLAGFLTAGLSIPLWTKIRQRRGARFTGIFVFVIWAIALLVFMCTWDFISGLLAIAFVGVGLGGSIFFYDQCIAEIIDEDEIRYGTRRAGAYYGVINFIIRLSGVFNFLIIGLIFTGTSWSNYTPNPGVDVIFGLRFLIGIYPAIVLIIGLVGLLLYPIKGARLEADRMKLTELHDRKRVAAVECLDITEGKNELR